MKNFIGKRETREQAQGKEGEKQAKPYQEGGEDPYHLITQSLGNWKHHLMWRSPNISHLLHVIDINGMASLNQPLEQASFEMWILQEILSQVIG